MERIEDLFAYIDDNYSFEILDNVSYYPPYNVEYPAKMMRLLLLWDELGIPHEQRKQIHGPLIPIIGFDVDVEGMKVTMPEKAKSELVDAIIEFTKVGSSRGSKRRPLRKFQQIAGWINWHLNVNPLLRPALASL